MNSNTHNQLRIEIQKKFGSTIKKQSDLKLLLLSIENCTQKYIGFNTIRRFFGFLNYTNPNLNTLNILSQYLGFSNYSSYQKKKISEDEWFIWNQIIKIELSEIISEEDIIWLQTQLRTYEYHLKIASIFKTLIYRKKYDSLNAFIDPRIFDFEESDRLKIASNICLLFRSLDYNTVNEVVIKLSPNNTFRENILHWFIDYSYLNGYYGSIIQEVKKYALPESHELLYYDLILNLNNFLSCKKKIELISLDRIKPNFYIVLKGRCYGYNLLYYKFKNDISSYETTWNKLLNEINNTTEIHLFTIEIFPILLLNKDLEKTNYLISNFYEDLLTIENWSGYPFQAMILLAQSIQLIHEKKIKEANVSFQIISLSKFSLSYKDYILLFYYIVEYKLGKLNNISKIQLKEIESKYQKTANQTGFKRFTLKFLREY
jgi:hypothetical protein